jgi:hypothetical protein
MPASLLGDPNVGGFLVIAFPLDNPGVWVSLRSKMADVGFALSYCVAYFNGFGNAIRGED